MFGVANDIYLVYAEADDEPLGVQDVGEPVSDRPLRHQVGRGRACRQNSRGALRVKSFIGLPPTLIPLAECEIATLLRQGDLAA